MNIRNELKELIPYVTAYLGSERDAATKKVTSDLIMKELSLRPSIDNAKFIDRLQLSRIGTVNRYLFVERFLIPDIRAGKYDGIAEQAKQKPPLLSTNLFKAMDEIGVKDDIDRTIIDYYLGVVWEQSDITIEEIRYFTENAIKRMKSLPEEERKTSALLDICKHSRTLHKHLSTEKTMEKVQEWIEEDKSMDDEFKAICGGNSDDGGDAENP